MPELVFRANGPNNTDALFLQRWERADGEQNDVVWCDSASPLRHHCPCELLQFFEAERLSLGSDGACKHRPVERDTVRRQFRSVGIVGGEISKKPQIVAGDDGSRQGLRHDTTA